MAPAFLPIERVRNLSEQDFEAVISEDRPIIIEDVVSQWKAFDAWTPDYLVQRIGHVRIPIRASSSHIHPDLHDLHDQRDRSLVLVMLARIAQHIFGRHRDNRIEMTFADFVALLTGSAEGFRYMAGAEELRIIHEGQWNESLAGLRPDFAIPEYVAQPSLDSAALWLSAKGVRSHLHYDGNSLLNLNAQVAGSKHVQLYSPTQVGNLYPYLLTNGHPHTFSRVNVEKVDPEEFPLFSQLQGYEETLKAGDLLFIPAYWYHSFKHLGDFNINLNFWWRAEFVRLTPVSARDYLGQLIFGLASTAKIPPFWLIGWLRKIERHIIRAP